MQSNEEQDADRQAEIENLLCNHPGVREAALVHDGCNGFVAFIVPDDTYMDEVLGRRSAESAMLGKWQKTYDLTQFTKEAESAPVGFNTLAWNSSYTRQPIPAEEMREWVETTVTDILELSPKTVYEIGCGTGMLLMRIAPHCDRYVGVDFSQVVLKRLREQLRTFPSLAERVEVMERRADNFDDLEENSFDTVVINSVSQHFPNLAYLTHVVENAVSITKPGGHVFIGDVRSLPLLPGFDSSVELSQAPNQVSVGDLRDRIKRRVQREQQLVLSPAYFLSLRRSFPKISGVEIRLRRGRADNEMSRYRYNAILHVGHRAEATFDVTFQDWRERELTLDEIRSMFQGSRVPIGIQHIQNARIEKDRIMLERLRNGDAAPSAGELKRELEQCCTSGIHPQDLMDLEAQELGSRILTSWSASRADGSYDALFIPRELMEHQPCCAANWPHPEPSDFVRLANSPGQDKFRAELVERILEHCRLNLRAESVPCEVSLIDMQPRAADGSVDTGELLAARLAIH
jgi:SAM-dependent methyltransferase